MRRLAQLVMAGFSVGVLAAEQPRIEVSTQDVAQEYEFYKAKSEALKEYKFAYVLTRTQEDIARAQRRLKEGETLGAVARDMSIDPASRLKDGELFWADPIVWDPRMAEAVFKLKPGEMTPEPVQSPFGWAIIKVLQIRQAVFPPLWALEPALRYSLNQRLDMIQNYSTSGQPLATLFPRETISPVIQAYLIRSGADKKQLEALPDTPGLEKPFRTMMAMLNLKFFEYPNSKGKILNEKVVQEFIRSSMNR